MKIKLPNGTTFIPPNPRPTAKSKSHDFWPSHAVSITAQIYYENESGDVLIGTPATLKDGIQYFYVVRIEHGFEAENVWDAFWANALANTVPPNSEGIAFNFSVRPQHTDKWTIEQLEDWLGS
jgi:hypothetical protein